MLLNVIWIGGFVLLSVQTPSDVKNQYKCFRGKLMSISMAMVFPVPIGDKKLSVLTTVDQNSC